MAKVANFLGPECSLGCEIQQFCIQNTPDLNFWALERCSGAFRLTHECLGCKGCAI